MHMASGKQGYFSPCQMCLLFQPAFLLPLTAENRKKAGINTYIDLTGNKGTAHFPCIPWFHKPKIRQNEGLFPYITLQSWPRMIFKSVAHGGVIVQINSPRLPFIQDSSYPQKQSSNQSASFQFLQLSLHFPWC